MLPILDTRDALALLPVDPSLAQGLSKVAEAAGDVPEPEAVESKPDRVFALVFDRPCGRQRRYPVDGADPTRLAVAEFETFGRHVEPAETARVAGANLVCACERFGLEVPQALRPFRDESVVTNLAPAPQPTTAKTAAARDEGPSALTIEGRSRFPLRHAGEVRAAGRYFQERLPEIPPAWRHPFARKTAARASDLGIELPQTVRDYAVHGYSPYLPQALVSRVAAATGPRHRRDLLDLCRKKASLDPEAFADSLCRIDRAHGCARYGRQLADPWTSVYFRAREAAPDSKAAKGAKTAQVVRHLWKLAAQSTLADVLGPDQARAFLEDPDATAARLDPVAAAVVAALAGD